MKHAKKWVPSARLLFPAILFFTLLSTGCGGVGEVRGKVFLLNKELKSGTVSVKVDGHTQIYSGLINEQGEFAIPNVPSGEASLAISGGGGKAGPRNLPGDPGKVTGPVIPEKYSRFTDSGIRITVPSGGIVSQEFRLE